MTNTSRKVEVETKTKVEVETKTKVEVETKAKVKVEKLNYWTQKVIQIEKIAISALDDDLEERYELEGLKYNNRERLIMRMRICNRSAQDIAGELKAKLSGIRSDISKGTSKIIRLLSQESPNKEHHISETQNVTNRILKKTILNLGYGADEKPVNKKQAIIDAITASQYSEKDRQRIIRLIEEIDKNDCQ